MEIKISYQEELKRKAIHLSSLWMVAATLLLPALFRHGRWICCLLFAALLIFTLITEHDYANGGKYLGRLYGKLFRKMLRKEARPGMWVVSGGAFVLAAGVLVNLLFAPPTAAAALAVMLIGDTAAALIGRRFGKHPAPNGKSWEGVTAFIIAGYAALAVTSYCANAAGYTYIAGIPAVILAAFAELFEKQLRLDDNFSIPLCIGVTVAAAEFAVQTIQI